MADPDDRRPTPPAEPATGAAAPRMAELTGRLLELLGRVSGLESTYLTLVDWERQVQEILYARNTGDLTIPEGLEVDWQDTLCRRALEGGPAATSAVPEVYPDSGAARDLGIQTYITAPVVGPDGGVYGTLCGASRRRVGLSEDVRLLVKALAEMLSLQLAHDAAMERLAAANAELERLASTDPLTGLFNRRHLNRELLRICSFARRRGEPVSLVVLDVDHFKEVNDGFGHAAGDDVLAGIAEHLRRQCREEDVVGRLGGDEFVLVLAATGRDGAARLAERARAAIAGAAIPTRVGPVAATVSVGVATGDGTDPELLQRDADAALYEAKAAGRNAVATGARGHGMVGAR